MKQSTVKRMTAAMAGILLLSLLLSSCSAWSWLWEREGLTPVDSEDLILGGSPEEDDAIFEGAVDYDGSVHSGTDIYYVGNRESENRNRIIVIDPGHQLKGSSAKEPNGPASTDMKAEVTWGATGVYTGGTEYELNLRVALLLRDELVRRGYSVVMIRETNNVSISNMERAQIANKYSAAAYIRIHANSWTDDSMHGAMTICQSAANPYPTCAIHYPESRLLSELVLDSFCAETGIHKLNVREMDDMTGTNWSQVPTTIVEMGFLSNVSDDSLMATDYFRQEAAIGIANGLDAYFDKVDEGYFDVPPDETLIETLPSEPATDTPATDAPATDDPAVYEPATEAPAPAETEAPAPAETEAPAPVETEVPAPAETEVPAPVETEVPAPAETQAPAEDGSTETP